MPVQCLRLTGQSLSALPNDLTKQVALEYLLAGANEYVLADDLCRA